VPLELRAQGWIVEAHDDHFAEDTKDEELLAELERREWILITEDKRIRYRPAERAAFTEAGLRMFVLTSGNLSAAAALRILLAAKRHIAEVLSKESGPFMYRIAKDGGLKRLE
jgi:predicted nuclease of predicted toxin-antitoxin system